MQSQTRQNDEGKASMCGSVAPVDEVYAAAGRPTAPTTSQDGARDQNELNDGKN